MEVEGTRPGVLLLRDGHTGMRAAVRLGVIQGIYENESGGSFVNLSGGRVLAVDLDFDELVGLVGWSK